jgi:hypothetical protein
VKEEKRKRKEREKKGIPAPRLMFVASFATFAHFHYARVHFCLLPSHTHSPPPPTQPNPTQGVHMIDRSPSVASIDSVLVLVLVLVLGSPAPSPRLRSSPIASDTRRHLSSGFFAFAGGPLTLFNPF